MNSLVKFITLFVSIFCFSLSLATAKMEPPPGVAEIIETMGVFEENFESGNWEATDESLGKIDSELREVFAKSNLNDSKLEDLLENLKKSVQLKDEKFVETNYILFQRQYFDFIDNFHYEIHPILLVIKKYIVEEAAHALAEKDFDDIVGEMREAANLIDYAKPLLVEKGISEDEVDSLKLKIIQTIKAGRVHDVDNISLLLKEVQQDYLSLLERYKTE